MPAQKQASLFCDGRQKEEEEALLGTQCLIATAVITLFNVSTVDPQIAWVFMPGASHLPLRLMPKVKPSSSEDRHGDRWAGWFATLDEGVHERWGQDSL